MSSAPPIEFVFATVDGVDLRADVFVPAGEPSGGLLLWFHGGALILGSRRDLPTDVRDLGLSVGATVVSVDYRLAPQATIAEIAADVEAAWHWTVRSAPGFGATPDRILAAGSSAGGYLALLTGLMDPRPRGVLSYYGYGTFDSAWYTTPSVHYRSIVPLADEAVARAAVGTAVVVDGYERPDAAQYYFFCRQNGLWPQLAAGVSLPAERDVLRRYSPTYQVTSEFPETMLLHGTSDNDVPYAEAVALAAMLELHGVPHELISLEGFDHGLVPGDDAASVEQSARATERATAFIRRLLGSCGR